MLPASKPVRIYIALSEVETWHRREWEEMLSTADTTHAKVVSRSDDADCVLSLSTPWQFSRKGSCFGRTRHDPDQPARFIWDQSDLPTGHERGFYCSLPRQLFDARRHRTCHYAISFNECIRPGDFSEARKLMGFVGGVTSGLRSRLVQHLKKSKDDNIVCEEQSGPWNQMFDRSGLPIKSRYADLLRSCRFFLCPRGNGVGTVRLFETMQSARVPVILSDDYVLPAGIDWSRCSVRVKERDFKHLPELLRERDGMWTDLATAARREWERHFSSKQFLHTLSDGMHNLRAAPVMPSAGHAFKRLRFLAALKSRQKTGRARSALSRMLGATLL